MADITVVHLPVTTCFFVNYCSKNSALREYRSNLLVCDHFQGHTSGKQFCFEFTISDIIRDFTKSLCYLYVTSKRLVSTRAEKMEPAYFSCLRVSHLRE